MRKAITKLKLILNGFLEESVKIKVVQMTDSHMPLSWFYVFENNPITS